MQKTCKSLILKVVTFVVLAFGLATPVHAQKTLMWLADWYQMGNIDTVTTIKSVYIPHFNATAGYFYGTADQNLRLTTAYAAPIPVNAGYRNDTLPDSLKIPTELNRNWYALSNFNTSNYQAGRIRIYMEYSGQKHMAMLNQPLPKVQVDLYPNGIGQTDQLEPAFTDGCIDSTMGDTVWFWTGALTSAGIQSNATGASIKCLDHNPFFKKVGTVHLLNPWPGKTVYAQVGDRWYPLYQESGRQGWVSSTLWTDPRNPQPFTIRLANGDPTKTTAVQYMDAGGLGVNASGVSLDFTTSPGMGGEVWIIPPTSTTKPTVALTAPAVALSLYIKRPTWSASAVRVLWKGNDSRFVAASTKYCDWFLIQFYKGAVPDSILLSNPIGDTVYGAKGKEKAPALLASYNNWISIKTQGAVGGTFSLNTDANPLFLSGVPTTGGLCDTKILAFSAYDFKGINGVIPATDPFFYEPFSQAGPDNNCPGSGNKATKGLVMATLTNGLPLMNRSHASACGINTNVVTNGPQFWFDTLWKSSTGVLSSTRSAGATQLNYFHCVRVPLSLDAAGQYYSYNSSNFWPLDSAKSIPTDYRNATGNDFKFAMHAKSAFEYVPGLKFEFKGDDDVWIFIDKKLALDVGGQHGPNGGIINIDNLGLVEGKSYQFDMFYTERMGDGSSISIKTTMNLVPMIDVSFDTTKSTAKTQVIDSWLTETTADASRCPEQGGATTVTPRPGNPTYTLLFPDGSELQIDSVYASGNLPGAKITGNGSHFEIDTSAVQKSGKLTMSGLYQIRVDLGAESRTIGFSNVSKSVDVAGTLFDANGDGYPDSVILRTVNSSGAFKSTFSALLRWADRAGNPDSVVVPATSLKQQLGDSVMTGTFLLPSRTSCPPTGCNLKMGWVYTGFATDTVNNPIVSLADGIAPVADSAWLVYDTTGTAQDTLFVIASEALVAYAGLLPKGDSAYVLTGRSAAPRPVAGTAILVGNVLKLPLDPATNPIQPNDSIRLGGFSGDVLGNAPGVLSKWVYLKADPVAKSWMLDVNGDGYPDSIGIGSKGSLATATSATVHWKTSAGIDTVFAIATPAGVTGGLKLPVGILKNATFCAGCYLELDMGTQTKKFTLLDSVAPVALDAKLRYGTSQDTLFVTVSEPFEIGTGAGEGVAAVKKGNAASTLVTGTGSAVGTVLQVLVAPGSVDQDSVRLRAWILGNLKKAVGANSPFVKIEYGPQPIRVAVYDKNGDGLVDSVTYTLTRSAAGAPAVTGFGLTWGGQPLTTGALNLSVDGMTWSGPVVSTPLLTTPSAGDQGWLVVGTDITSYRAVVEDSVAPVAFNASLIFGLEEGDPDTLRIEPSESFLALATGTYAIVGTDSASTTIKAVTNTNSMRLTGSTSLQLVVASGAIDNNMTWVRLGSAISDNGKAVGASSRWVKLALKPSGRAYLLDANGDGRADSMRVFVRGAMNASQAVLTWKTKSGAPDSRTWAVAPSVGPFGVHPSDPLKWFDFGATSCTGCTVKFLDAAGSLLVEWQLADSVAPIALSGKYAFGVAQDTLTVNFSEDLKPISESASWLEWGNTILGGSILHTIVRAPGNTATFFLTPANGAVEGWDSLRLAVGAKAGNVADAGGKIVGSASPWAPITYGIAPFQAWLLDPNGAGQGTAVRVSLIRQVPKPAVAAIDGFQFSWTKSDGTGVDERSVKVTDLVWDGASSWTGALPTPFALGQTGCASNCAAVAIAKDASQRGTSLLDSVPPSAVAAKFRYSLPDIGLDTLVIKMSESWVGEHPGNLADVFARYGTKAKPNDLLPIRGWDLVGGTELILVVSDSFAGNLSQGDSTRLAYIPQGSRVWDAANNRVGVESRWVPIEFGLRPPRLEVKPYRPVLENIAASGMGWTVPPASFPQVELLEKNKDGSFSKLEASGGGSVGGAPVNDTARTLGVDIRINRPLEGILIIYDNMGVAVVSLDLSPLKSLWDNQQDAEKTIRFQWNGTGPDHKFVASGVYLFRAVVKFQDKEGKKDFRNIVWKLGFHRDTK